MPTISPTINKPIKQKSTPLYEKLQELPFTIYYMLHELFTDIISNPWITMIIQEYLSLFLALIIHFIVIINLLDYHQLSSQLDTSITNSYLINLINTSTVYSIQHQLSSNGIKIILMLIISLGNTIYFFKGVKTYSLFFTDVNEKLVDIETGYFKSKSLRVKRLYHKNKWWWDWWSNKKIDLTNTKDSYIELRMWDIDNLKFYKNLFCYCSPLHLIIYLIIKDNTDLIMILTFNSMLSFMLKYLISQYLQLIQDKEILYSQVQREYNLKSVYPTYQKYEILRNTESIREKALNRAKQKVNNIRKEIVNNKFESNEESDSSFSDNSDISNTYSGISIGYSSAVELK
ncbi:hypothetical protein K502DRAFT_323622 [Neoconidiobolus thromboides FSU 785]|nr:hypothetical protein K502DRAFT_323622 [Neoconidiobolus thromboides FSU 785]